MTAEGKEAPGAGGGRPPTEEELLAAYEEQLKRLRVDDVLVQTIVSLLNLGGRKTGAAPGTEGERDLDQVRTAVDAVRALLPVVEPALGSGASRLRDALAQLQMAYARLAAQGATSSEPATGVQEPTEGEPATPGAGGPGPAQRSGRLWVPGQGPPH